jgi:tetratricopeptide (TPR) repeat protein
MSVMNSSRLDVLRTMVEQEPGNAFARYGLAMEHVNRGEHENAAREFEALFSSTPDYLPGYFHAGRTLEKLGRLDEARDTYQKGIELATRKGDAHTRSELQAALDMAGL